MKVSLDQMGRYFDRVGPQAESWQDSFRDQWRKVLTQSVLDRVEIDATDVVLDLGCGTGLVARHLASVGATVYGVDCSAVSLELGKSQGSSKGRLEWVLGDLRDFQAPKGLTTIVLCSALRYLDEAERRALFQRCWDQLPSDGLLVIGDWIWTLPADLVEGSEELYEPLSYTVYAEPTGELLQACGFAPRLVALHPAVSVITALKP